MNPAYTIVVPTVGRPSLAVLLRALGSGPEEIILVNDRPGRPLPVAVRGRCRIVDGRGRGPAAARNDGWRAARTPWVVFVDDDVVPDPMWTEQLRGDLLAAEHTAAVAVQGRLTVPLPARRRPTDWERQTAGLATAAWITADLAYRRDVLAAVGGFDERFPRAFREDAELALRVRARGHRLIRGERRAAHPVRPAGPLVSVGRQAGNADDALLRRLYGPQWRGLAMVPPGRRARHALVTAAGLVALATTLAGRRGLAAAAAVAWLAGTTEFAARRIAPGPRTPREVAAMALTSVAIPPLAIAHWVRGWIAHRHARPLKAVAG